MTPDVAAQLEAYEEENDFLRRFTFPQEERPDWWEKWSGGYRWFKSENVICLEKVRRLRRG